ncbi:MAG: YbaB/EbfC family nucleoid-associated protein [Alphaproteobacteria bacterium]|nr:YbaB/EbfC family nucleoid-associated protein [Alphaproteobacteria bacterium]
MNFKNVMKQAQEMQAKIAQLQQKLEEEETEGASGGGMVKITLNGKGELKKIVIDPSLLAASEKEILEDLIVAAFKDTKSKVDAAAGDQMSKIAGGMGLPPGFKLPF